MNYTQLYEELCYDLTEKELEVFSKWFKDEPEIVLIMARYNYNELVDLFQSSEYYFERNILSFYKKCGGIKKWLLPYKEMEVKA